MPVPASEPTRRSELVAAAGRLFGEHGYHGTSIRMIAEVCGIRSASLYSHFASKEQLFIEVVDDYFHASLPALAAAAHGPGTGAERLAAMIESSVEVGLAHRDAFLALSNDWSLIRRSAPFEPLRVERDRATSLWSEVLRGGTEDGSLRPDVSPAAALWILYSAVIGMVGERHGDGTGVPAPPSTATLVQVLLEGLAPR